MNSLRKSFKSLTALAFRQFFNFYPGIFGGIFGGIWGCTWEAFGGYFGRYLVGIWGAKTDKKPDLFFWAAERLAEDGGLETLEQLEKVLQKP